MTQPALALRSGLTYFTWVFCAGFVLGAVRVPLVVPLIGERWAELAEMPLMLAVIWVAARHVVCRYALPRRAAARWATGLVALALLIAGELLVALAAGRTIAQAITGRDPVSGTVYLGMLGVFAAMPWLRMLAEKRRTPQGKPAQDR